VSCGGSTDNGATVCVSVIAWSEVRKSISSYKYEGHVCRSSFILRSQWSTECLKNYDHYFSINF